MEDLQRIEQLEKSLNDLKNLIFNPRVQIENFEGVFKTISTAPAVGDYRDGTILLFDDNTDRKLYAKINGAFYSATLT